VFVVEAETIVEYEESSWALTLGAVATAKEQTATQKNKTRKRGRYRLTLRNFGG
jgi:hypothetical protein